MVFDPQKKHEKEWKLLDLNTAVVNSTQLGDFS
jgi:hypothetical protein